MIFADIKADVKQQEIKKLVAFLKRSIRRNFKL